MKKIKMEISYLVPAGFKPPIVRKKEEGLAAFHMYDWYFDEIARRLSCVERVFLTPCAATKPIYASSLHRSVYQKFAAFYGRGRELLVVSEPVVIIRYKDLYNLEPIFCYDFPPKLLDKKTRELFVERLRIILSGKDIIGCLPRHHSTLVRDAIGDDWINHWKGDLYDMMAKAAKLKIPDRIGKEDV